MPYNPPDNIKIISDDNELKYQRTVKEKTQNKFEYVFTKSFTLLGKTILFSEVDLIRYFNNGIFKEI